MKIFSLIILSFATLSFLSKKQCNCSEYKTGSFYYFQNSSDTIFIDRTSNLQIEGFKYFKNTLKVIWLNNCKFILRNSHNKSNKVKILEFDVVSKIIETTDTYYITEVWMKGCSKSIYKIFRI